jgi:hypothetical protein
VPEAPSFLRLSIHASLEISSGQLIHREREVRHQLVPNEMPRKLVWTVQLVITDLRYASKLCAELRECRSPLWFYICPKFINNFQFAAEIVVRSVFPAH